MAVRRALRDDSQTLAVQLIEGRIQVSTTLETPDPPREEVDGFPIGGFRICKRLRNLSGAIQIKIVADDGTLIYRC